MRTVTVIVGLLVAGVADAASPVRFVVETNVVGTVDNRLFGQFLERPFGGEAGPEHALVPGTSQLQPRVVELMKEMRIPVIRFPGGTHVDYTDWRDMLSNAPGREGQTRTNRFGFDEYFRLRDELKCETILVVNFLDAVAKKRPVEEAALAAAGLVAYANAPQGAKLPAGMPDWPAVRARNGHPKPFGTEYVQIGNELFLKRFTDEVVKAIGTTNVEEAARWYVECFQTYVKRIHEVDPRVNIIIDGIMGLGGIRRLVLADPFLRANVRYVTFHRYAPGGVDTVRRDGQPYSPDKLTADDWWHAWVGMPGTFSATGENLGLGADIEFARSLGYEIACTEWNWNGFGFNRVQPKPPDDWPTAAGLGAAGFLQGMMRSGGAVKLATQSMLVGSRWQFAAIRADPTAKSPPYFQPQGQATMFYNRHHGPRLLRSQMINSPTYEQPFGFGWTPPELKQVTVAYLDALATADARTLYLHIINRHPSDSFTVPVDLSGFGKRRGVARHLIYGNCRPAGTNAPPTGAAACAITTSQIRYTDGALPVVLPPRTINIIEVPLPAVR